MLQLLAQRWVVAVVAVVLLVSVARVVAEGEADRAAAAVAALTQTVDAKAAVVQSWLDEAVGAQREAGFLLSTPASDVTAEDLADLLEVPFVLVVSSSGRLEATSPERSNLVPGDDLRGRFGHVDAVLGGAPLGIGASDVAVTATGRALLLAVPTGDLVVSTARDLSDTDLRPLLEAAGTSIDGVAYELVASADDVVVLSSGAINEDPDHALVETELDAGLVLRASAQITTLDALVGGTTDTPGRLLVLGLAALLLAFCATIPPRLTALLEGASVRGQGRTLLHTTTLPALLTGEDGRVLEVNQALLGLGGWTRDAFVGLPLHELGGVATFPTDRIGTSDNELTLPTPAGSVRNLHVTTTGLGVGPGDETALHQLTDVTEHRAAVSALRSSREELERFVFRVAHDITSPLSAAVGLADLAGRDDLSDEIRNDIIGRLSQTTRAVHDAVERMVVRATADHDEVWEAIELRALHDELERFVAADLVATGGSIDLDVRDAVVVVPPDTLRTVLVNLVVNALKYRRDGIPPRLVLRQLPEPDAVHLVLEDNGLGVRPDRLEAIFRAGHRESTLGAGVGHGLAECRRLVESWRGTIHAETRAPHGLAVHVRLPAAPARRRDDVDRRAPLVTQAVTGRHGRSARD